MKKKKIAFVVRDDDMKWVYGHKLALESAGFEVVQVNERMDFGKEVLGADGAVVFANNDEFTDSLARYCLVLPPTIYLYNVEQDFVGRVPGVIYVCLTDDESVNCVELATKAIAGEIHASPTSTDTVAFVVWPGNVADEVGYYVRLQTAGMNTLLLNTKEALAGVISKLDGLVIMSDSEYFFAELTEAKDQGHLPPTLFFYWTVVNERIKGVQYIPKYQPSKIQWFDYISNEIAKSKA